MATKKAAKQAKVRHSPMEHPRHQYPEETGALEAIAASCGLEHSIKWGKPCFMMGTKNIVLVQRFNEYVALMFFKGSLLSDPDRMLSRIGEHMQGPMQLRYTSVAAIKRDRVKIKAMIEEAMALELAGAKLAKKPVSEVAVPEELRSRMDADPAFRKAFEGLTPGRQKGYIYQIAGAKQAATRQARVEKFAPRILAGKGLLD